MNPKRLLACLCAAGLSSFALVSAPAVADATNVTVRGYLTGAYQVTDEEAFYLAEPHHSGINTDGSDHGSKFGLNIQGVISDSIFATAQFHSASAEDDYNTFLDWAFVTLNLNNNAALRAGKVKYDGALYSSVIDIGNLYPWIELPSYAYAESEGSVHGNHESFNGASLLYTMNSGDMTYSIDLYGGSIGEEEEVFRKRLHGVTVTVNWDDKVIFKANTNTSKLKADPDSMLDVVNFPELQFIDGNHHKITNFGIKVDWNNVVANIESFDVDWEDFKEHNAESTYAIVGYRFGKFLPHATVASIEKGDPATPADVMEEMRIPE
ncbi:MAG: hypothetical protein OEY67_08590 [Gammaproteobacteria bacterium]|nr:hypothetical protein [Gammaproteobacteria bacterium]